MKPPVRLVRCERDGAREQVGRLLDWMGVGPGVRGERVVIKPNLVTDVPEYIAAGANTEPVVLEGALAYLADAGARVKVVESETGTPLKGRRLSRVCALMGLEDLARRYGAEVVNLTQAEKVEQVWEVGGRALRLPLAREVLDARLLVNLPKLKTHKYATMTCSLKNLFGLVPDPLRIVQHRVLDELLGALGEVWFRRMAVVVDGLVAMEGDGPVYGQPVPMGLLIAGTNPLAVDYVAAAVMGLEATRVGHWRAAARRCGWEEAPAVEGLAVEDVARPFAPAGRKAFVRMEGWLMRHPAVVRLVFSDGFRRYVSRPLAPLLKRLRGGSYSWYTEKEEET